MITLAFILAVVLDGRSGQSNAFDAIAHPLMIAGLLLLETLLLLRPRTYPLVTFSMLIGSSVFFLTKLVYLLFFAASGTNIEAEFTESFSWIPGVYIVAFFTTNHRQARRVNLVFFALMLLTSLAYAATTMQAPSFVTLNALAQMNLANITFFVLTGIVYRFASRHAHTVAHAETLKQLAYTDALTGLPNRRRLEQQLGLAINAASQHTQPQIFSVLYIDLNGFKLINDTYGHEMGDQVLSVIAQRLRASCRVEDTVARISGDEFVAVLPATRKEGADAIIVRVREKLNQPLLLNGRELRVTASIGVSFFPEHGHDVQTLLNHADQAMYQVKSSARSPLRTNT